MKKIFIYLFLIILLLSYISSEETGKHILIFTLPNCEDCHILKTEGLKTLESQTGVNITYSDFSLENEKIYDSFLKLKEKYNLKEYDTPTVFYNFKFYSGLSEIFTELSEDIKTEPEKEWKDFKFQISDEKIKSSNKKIEIAFFYKEKCRTCSSVERFLRRLKKKYPNIKIKSFDALSQVGMEYMTAFTEFYKLDKEKSLVPPLLIIGEKVLTSEEYSELKAEQIIDSAKEGSLKIRWDEIDDLKGKSKKELIDTFKSFGIIGIITAGFLDGINPCAFATLLFFLSYLTMLNKDKKTILITGISFIIGDFISYMILGSAIMEFLQQFTWIPYIAKTVFFLTAIAAFIMAYLSFYDYYQAKRKRFKDMKLQLSEEKKKKIHNIIRTKIKTEYIAAAAFVMGFLVSFHELACTGQLYLPAIIYITNVSAYRHQAYSYLLLYNLVFLIPLISIFVISYFGITSKVLNEKFEKNVKNIKLATGIFFLFLGAGLLLYLLYF